MNEIQMRLIVMAFAAVLLSAANDLRGDLNITIVSSPKLGVDTVCVNQAVNLSCFTNEQTNITWLWSNQSEERSTITVTARQYAVVFTCKASEENGQEGEANVTVIANGTLPYIRAVNFYPYIEITEGKNITLTASITSSLPLSGKYPNWNVLSNNLPPTAKVINYTIDGVIYSNLSLYVLSYYDDTGNYTCTASNECGTSSVFTFIKVIKVSCNDSLKIIKSLHNSVTVSKEDFLFTCLFQGRLDFSVTSYWKVEFPPLRQREPIYISDNSNHAYHIAVNPTTCNCCNFTSQLIIFSVPPELNGANITCVEHITETDSKPVTQQSTATLTVLNYPSINDSLGSELCPTINDSVSLWCKFNAATMEGATIVVWLKDQIEITGYDNETKPVEGEDNKLKSTIYIKSFSRDDQGDYTCYCYYNKSIVTSDKTVTSDQATVHVHTDCSHKESKDASNKKLMILLYVTASVLGLTLLAIYVYCIIYKVKARRTSRHESQITSTATADSTTGNNTVATTNTAIDTTTTTTTATTTNTSTTTTNTTTNVTADTTSASATVTVTATGAGTTITTATNTTSHQCSSLPDTSQIATTEDERSKTKQLPMQPDLNHLLIDHSIASEAEEPTAPSSGNDTNYAVTFELSSECPDNASQSVTSGFYTQDVHGEGNKTPDPKQLLVRPLIFHLPTDYSIECEQENPRTSKPTNCSILTVKNTTDNASVGKPEVMQTSTPSVHSTSITEAGDNGRVLNLIAPDFTALVKMETLLPLLQKHNLVTRDEEYHLMNTIYSPTERAQKLLGYLKHKGDGCLQKFLCCLNLADEHMGHKELAEKLKGMMQSSGIDCGNFCSDDCEQSIASHLSCLV